MLVFMPPGAMPVALMLQHGPMIRTWLRLFVKSMLAAYLPKRPHAEYRPVIETIEPPARYLVEAYQNWCGVARPDALTVPPHLFCQWGLSPALRMFDQSPYNLAEVINQGVSMRVYAPLPAGRRLIVRASLESIIESGGVTQVAVRITTGTAEQPERVVAILHSAFLKPGASQRAAMTKPFKAATKAWAFSGHWQAEPGDGRQFALLTGDFNPIHWLDSAGRKSPFGRTVLQGLGMFARTYEQLARQGRIREIEVRFQRPVPLPSGVLAVETAPAAESGWNVVRLVDADQRACLTGRYR